MEEQYDAGEAAADTPVKKWAMHAHGRSRRAASGGAGARAVGINVVRGLRTYITVR